MKPRGVQIISEEVEKDVTFLADVNPHWVSLVKHAANQQPFRVIKEEKEKGGPGSGNFGHEGRPGEVGGSIGSGGIYETERRMDKDAAVTYFKAKPEDVKLVDDKKYGKVWLDESTGEVVPAKGYENKGVEKGGEGSGHPRHDGRPGEGIGGSRPYEGSRDWMRHGGALGMKDRIINIGEDSKAGGDGMSMIIQSIILPKGVTFDQLVTQKGLEFLMEADQTGKREFDKYTRFDQIPVEKFDKESLTFVKIHDSGVWAVGGKVLDDKTAEKALSLGKMDVPSSPMSEPVQTSPEAMHITFGDMFYGELNALTNVISGVMSQAGRKTGERKGDIMKAMDAFGAFLSMSLDSIGEKAVQLTREEIPKEDPKGGEEDMFKTKEEFVAAFKEAFDASFKGAFDVAMKEYDTKKAEETEEEKKKRLEEEEKKRLAEEKAKGSTVQVLSPEMKEMMKTVVETSKQVKEMAEKMEKLGNQPIGDPSGNPDPDPKPNDKGKSVFAGFFSAKAPVS